MKRAALVLLVLFLLGLCACQTSPSAPPTITLSAGNYTPLGGTQKSAVPTASELADLQSSESGALGKPALVEFYADY